jgi:hypothetical protein
MNPVALDYERQLSPKDSKPQQQQWLKKKQTAKVIIKTQSVPKWNEITE